MIDLSNRPLPEPIMETIDAVRDFEKTPLAEQFPYTNSYELMMSASAEFGDTAALEFLLQGLADEPAQTTTFTELGAQVTRTANFLSSLGVSAGDSVSIVLPVLPQTHFAIWGAQAAGISNPINPLLEPEHMAEIISAAKSKVVICLGKSPAADIWEKTLAAAEQVDSVTQIIAVNVAGMCDPTATLPAGSSLTLHDFDKAIAPMNAGSLDSGRQFAADQIAAYFHTGGTTGRPKLAQLTHGNMAFLGQLMQVYTAHMEHHTVLCGLPLFHIYGCIIQGIASFAVGYRILLMTPVGFRSTTAMPNIWKLIERFKVKQISAVPTVLMALSEIPVGDADISSLTNINSGAAPLSHPFELSFEERFNVEIGNGYGMTETTALISRAPIEQPPGSVGMRVPYSHIRIAHLEGAAVIKDCAVGESGVILVKGPQVFAGYKVEADNNNAWIEDGWFNTGDLGYLDENDCLFLSGRAKDLIIRSGHNIDPELIEEPINSHPDVVTSVAIGLPDAYTGELPMAYVVKRQGSELSETDLIAYAAERISERAAVPKRIDFIDAMPLTAVGKIFRPALRQRIGEEVVAGLLEQAGIQAALSSENEKKRGLVIKVETHDKSQIDAVRDLVKSYIFATDVS
ncbi:MAG: acyl-CoA synthetase [Gammaproteobacteria bacterium]|nr:acyl-CoA synthetase [Gammaproteobacteria bacterium]